MNVAEQYNIPKDAILTVAGTVGVGKSTMTHRLAEALGFRTSLEKVEGNPYLDLYYQNFSRWSFHLQIYFLAERFKEQKRIFEYGGGFIQDRSIYEDTGIFAKMLYQQGNMNETDFETYTSLFEAMVMTPYFPHPNMIIYLEGTFDDIVQRVQERGRPMEQETPLAYWKELHERYENWINQFNACPILRLNINEYDLVKNPESIYPILERIGKKLNYALPQR
ncbi:deoxynucleoside kinase [Bacillus horti]|uniref:Deoxyadenosine/deoxycytidine kinase n=1 Tax=Caldalkalibacillus horti TaxID=77523 RepID=A0ABT9W2Q3_9BACI|nr:deoxynucleoside kinase [Bacillus horti]MDQ0167541.1 deoxyadenosine/deoxycytidine kinase [Bacillus horti]